MKSNEVQFSKEFLLQTLIKNVRYKYAKTQKTFSCTIGYKNLKLPHSIHQ